MRELEGSLQGIEERKATCEDKIENSRLRRMLYRSKQNTNAARLKQNFVSYMHEHSSSKHIYTDGSKSQNGVCFGVVYRKNLI